MRDQMESLLCKWERDDRVRYFYPYVILGLVLGVLDGLFPRRRDLEE